MNEKKKTDEEEEKTNISLLVLHMCYTSESELLLLIFTSFSFILFCFFHSFHRINFQFIRPLLCVRLYRTIIIIRRAEKKATEPNGRRIQIYIELWIKTE